MTEPMHEAPSLISVFDDRICIGHLLRRGKDGVEAYDTDTVSLGIYSDVDAAALAVWRHARRQWIDWPVDEANAQDHEIVREQTP
jgi:hypothetical protein